MSESRWAWTRALPLLAEAFPDLVTPMLREAIVVSPIQVCRTAELEPDQFIVAGSQTEEPPVEFSALDSYKGVPVRSYVIGLPHLLDYRKWEQPGSDPISVLAGRSIKEVFDLPSVRAALRFRWHNFSERFFNYELVLHLVFLLILSLNVICIAREDLEQSLFSLYASLLGLVRLPLLVALVSASLWFALCTYKRACTLKGAFFASLWNNLEVLAHGAVFWMVAAHLQRLEAQYSVASIAVILAFTRTLGYARGHSLTGVQLRLVQRAAKQTAPLLFLLSSVFLGICAGFLWAYSPPLDEDSSRTVFQQFFGAFEVQTKDNRFQTLFALQVGVPALPALPALRHPHTYSPQHFSRKAHLLARACDWAVRADGESAGVVCHWGQQRAEEGGPLRVVHGAWLAHHGH